MQGGFLVHIDPNPGKPEPMIKNRNTKYTKAEMLSLKYRLIFPPNCVNINVGRVSNLTKDW